MYFSRHDPVKVRGVRPEEGSLRSEGYLNERLTYA